MEKIYFVNDHEGTFYELSDLMVSLMKNYGFTEEDAIYELSVKTNANRVRYFDENDRSEEIAEWILEGII